MVENTFENKYLSPDAYSLVYSKTCRIPGGTRRHSQYEIFCHISGPLVFEVEGETYPLHPGDIMLFPPGVEHRAYGIPMPEETPYEVALMKLKPDLLSYISCQFDDGKALSECFVRRRTGYLLKLSKDQRRINYEMIHRLLQIQEFPKEYGHSINVLSMVFLYLVNLYNNDAEFRAGSAFPESGLTENVQNYIERHYSSSLTLDQLAEIFFVSKYYLLHDFRRNTGTSVYRYLTQKRLQAVSELLEQGVPPSEAYQRCGFKDYANFYRAFRNEFGQCPREYAKAHRKAAEESAAPDE